MAGVFGSRSRMREHMAGRVKLVTSERGDAEGGSKMPPDKGYAHKKVLRWPAMGYMSRWVAVLIISYHARKPE